MDCPNTHTTRVANFASKNSKSALFIMRGLVFEVLNNGNIDINSTEV